MAISENQKLIKKLLKTADVNIDGKRDQDIQVLDDRLYDRVMSEGSMGAGESYMDGWWRVKKLDKFFAKDVYKRQAYRREFGGVLPQCFFSPADHNLTR